MPLTNMILFLIVISLSLIKGEKIKIFLKTKYPINTIKVAHDKIKINHNINKKGDIYFYLDAEQGEKILLEISSKFFLNKPQNFLLYLKFMKGNLYFFNHKNITIINNKNDITLFEFYVPYEIYCNSHNDIFIDDTNIINFKLNNNIFSKSNKNQAAEQGIKIIDFYYYSKKDILSVYPNINFNKSENYLLNKTFNIDFKNGFNKNNSFIIKYKGINYKTGKLSFNECLLEIKKDNKRNLQTATSTETEYYYTFGEIFDNEEAVENIDDIVEFLNQDINIFNISEDFFQDLCIHYEKNKADYVLEDRIEFFYQNYSLCNSSCNLSQIYCENFSFSCICWPEVESGNSGHHKKVVSMELNEEFSMEGLSQEMSNLFFESNLSVISCFFVLLGENLFFSNYGLLLTGILLLIQIFASFFLCSHMNDIRLYVFRDLIKCKYNPPKKQVNIYKQDELGVNNIIDSANSAKRINTRKTYSGITSVNSLKKGRKINKKYGEELSSVKGMIPINSNNTKIIANDIDIYNNYPKIGRNKTNTIKFESKFSDNNESNVKLKDSFSSQKKLNIKNKSNILTPKINLTQKNETLNNSQNCEINIYRKNTKRSEEEKNNNINNISYEKNNIDNQHKEKYETNIKKSENNYIQSKSILISKASNKIDNQDKDLIHPYEKMDYDEYDLDGLDYDEALIYDKRTFCQLFCKQLKERQLIANTFCVTDKLKPFSIKVILLIFNLSCYLVVNGFLFNEEYVMKILRRKSKNFYYFLVDSVTRIVYSSIIGVVINIIVGLLFRADKQLRKVQSKYEGNKILLHGEIVKIYKSTKNLYIIFSILNVFIMLVFIFYLFCFCGVYRNCQADWFEGCFIVIFLMQILPVFLSLLLAVLRKGGLICKVEFLFKINSWIIENL